MKLGIVSFINALPFTLGLKRPVLLDVPSNLNAMLSSGQLDCALTSCLADLDADNGPFGIAATNQILSVNLYTSKPLHKLQSIAPSPKSATSNALLHILCANFWKIAPTFTSDSKEAFLLIGDEALSNQNIPGYQTIDLATAWQTHTELPFVFAHFCGHMTPELLRDIETAYEWSQCNFSRVLDEAQKRTALPYNLLEKYYQCCNYRLGNQEKQGLALFTDLYHARI